MANTTLEIKVIALADRLQRQRRQLPPANEGRQPDISWVEPVA